ncbi:hypothetical protein [Streptomyces sp. NBC_00009]|uniref:hypothetical protein n=1 Tax=Streptomyces sp. NBC_00009 TaxID=2975620 RepID=UPI003246BB14
MTSTHSVSSFWRAHAMRRPLGSVNRDGANVSRVLTDQSTYDRTVLYDTFDVTRLVRSGG